VWCFLAPSRVGGGQKSARVATGGNIDALYNLVVSVNPLIGLFFDLRRRNLFDIKL